jgi:hypothetical protein
MELDGIEPSTSCLQKDPKFKAHIQRIIEQDRELLERFAK